MTNTNGITVFVDNDEDLRAPSKEDFQAWVSAALKTRRNSAELSIRIVDTQESQALNLQYRNKDYPTNVLSFPAEFPEGVDIDWLGDLVICQAVVEQEAVDQNKRPEAHWAHLTVHGVLHLLGFDHIEEDEAEAMEHLETVILTKMGYPPPYQGN